MGRNPKTSKMIMKVEFLAGTTIEDCIAEAAHKCRFLDLAYVAFDFNGVSVSVTAKTDVKWGCEQVMRAIQYSQKSVVI